MRDVVEGVEGSAERTKPKREAQGMPPLQPGSAEDARAAAEDWAPAS